MPNQEHYPYITRLNKIAPPRLELALTPTPLMPLKRIGQELGVDLWIKRDDCTGSALGGNKIRKLEYVLADAINQGADTVITCGGAQSNHCRATAIAAACLGLSCLLLLRVPNPADAPPLEANSLLDAMAGARIVYVTPEEYRGRELLFAQWMKILRKEGARPYAIPEGASNALGAWGYVRVMAELAEQLSMLDGTGSPLPTTIIHATGSGGTGAGLILGKRMFGLENFRVSGINVCDDRNYFLNVQGEICEKAISTYNLGIDFRRERDIEIVDGFVGKGYALSRPEELSLIVKVCRAEGIVLDPVYTGKAFFGMVETIKKDSKAFGERIVFVHTGGIFGLFPKTDELLQVI
jgi:D-cysteine desulfhydrase